MITDGLRRIPIVLDYYMFIHVVLDSKGTQGRGRGGGRKERLGEEAEGADEVGEDRPRV